MSSVDKSRDGRVLGRRALDTRARLLDALLMELAVAPGWRLVSVANIAREAGTSPATFYQIWHNVEHALFDLTRRQLAAGKALSARHLDVLGSLATWGWPGAKRMLAQAEAAKVEVSA